MVARTQKEYSDSSRNTRNDKKNADIRIKKIPGNPFLSEIQNIVQIGIAHIVRKSLEVTVM